MSSKRWRSAACRAAGTVDGLSQRAVTSCSTLSPTAMSSCLGTSGSATRASRPAPWRSNQATSAISATRQHRTIVQLEISCVVNDWPPSARPIALSGGIQSVPPSGRPTGVGLPRHHSPTARPLRV